MQLLQSPIFIYKKVNTTICGGDIMKAVKFQINTDAKSQGESIHNSISNLDGIMAVRVDSFANTVTVDYDDNRISSKDIESNLKQNNYIR